MGRKPPAVETDALVEGLPGLILRDEDREHIAEALAALLLARALADEAREAAS